MAGLDVGWHRTIDLQHCPKRGKYVATRPLLPGRYPFKFIIDGRWSYCMDYPTYNDGTNINNFLEVIPRTASAEAQETQARCARV